MLMTIMLAAIVVFAVLGVYLIFFGRNRLIGRIAAVASMIAALALPAFVGFIAVNFISEHSIFNSVIYVIVVLIVIAMISCGIFGVFNRKAVVIPLLSALAVCGLTTVGFYVYQDYIDSIPTVGESDLRDYFPYGEETKVVTLGNATFALSEDLPIMDGATALYPIYSAFAKAVYPKELIEDLGNSRWNAASHPYLKCTTTPEAYYNIVTGDADIIFAAEPSEEQKQFAYENGVELIYTPIGKEAFVFFVNSQNPLNDITVEDVQKIYSGEITRWKDLGIEGLGKIKAFQRPDGSGSQSAILRLMQGKPLMTPPKKDVIDTMSGIVSKTADYKNFKNAIGYSFRFYSTEMAKNNRIKLLSLNGIEPTEGNIENGTYPIASEFYAVTRSNASENTKALLEWIQGEEGQKIIQMTGYTPVKKVF